MIYPGPTFADKTHSARRHLSRFAAEQSGAVTVDWVVLVAACIGLGITFASAIGHATQGASNDTARCLKIQKNIMKRDNIDYKTKLKRMKRRCGRI